MTFGKRLLTLTAAISLLAGCASGGSTGLGLNLVPQEQVQQMGLQAWQDIRSKTPASTDAAMQQRAKRVASKVLKAAGKDPAEWEVVVFQGKDLNAFALPGKKIGVYEGMMTLADTDAELATVIGHEIGHVTANHSAERVNSEMATQLGVDLASTVLGGATGVSADTVAGLLGAGAQYGMLLPYSRNQELAADKLGLNYMAEAGYDPRQSIDLWKKMEAQAANQPPAFLSTHPAHEQRIQQLQALMPQALETYRAHS